jgi:hypothetical protein
MTPGYTRPLMSASAAVLAALGLAGTFLPAEVLTRLGTEPTAPLQLAFQVLGALCLGFAMLNWMARGSLIGGIYNRPIVVGNLLHFTSAALAFSKMLLRAPEARPLWPLGLVYALLAAGFAFALFHHPGRAGTAAEAPRV